MEERIGLVHVITGEGRGKTTSSLGLSLRAVGQGFKVYVIQFLKSGDTGELFAVKKFVPNIKIIQCGRDASEEHKKLFLYDGKGELKPVGPKGKYYIFLPDDKEAEPARKALRHAEEIIRNGENDVVVLDEINCAISKGLIKTEDVLNLIKEKPKQTELILTGRGAPQELIDIADYASEVKKIKHPYDRGILARRGIEY